MQIQMERLLNKTNNYFGVEEGIISVRTKNAAAGASRNLVVQ